MKRDPIIAIFITSAFAAVRIASSAFINTRLRKDLEGLREACSQEDKGLAVNLRGRYLEDTHIACPIPSCCSREAAKRRVKA